MTDGKEGADPYELRLWTAAEVEDFVATFHDRALRRGSLPHFKRQLAWFFNGPYGGVFAAALFEGEPVASCGVVGRRLIRDGREITVCEIGETATDPEHQRRGLFSRLVRACRDRAFQNGAVTIYGTPNSQSTPGYAKLGFKIIEDPRAHLLLVPNPAYAFGPRPKDAEALKTPAAHKATPLEISLQDYVAATVGFPRLNAGTADYLTWRFGSEARGYRFFRDGDVYCALAPYQLGRLPVLAAAEYFRNGRRARMGPKLLAIALSAWRAASFAGVYLHGRVRTGMGRLGAMDRLAVVHRSLPLCIAGDIMEDADWLDVFQLSDCDIG